jgi:hypothetical protein
VREGAHVEAVAGLMELRRVYAGLSTVYPEDFGELLAKMDMGLDRLLAATRQQLLKDFLSPETSPTDLRDIAETLGQIISAGKRPSWSFDFDVAVDEATAAKAG